MAAANTDKLRKSKNTFSTTLSSSINDSDTTIPLSSASGLPTDTAITLTIDRVDANGTATPSAIEYVTGVISGNNLTNALRNEGGSTAAAHSSGAVVECVWDAESVNDLVDWGLVEHGQDGTHNADTIDAITEIAAALKSGSDGTVITGTKGTDGSTGKWNADGDLVDGFAPSGADATLVSGTAGTDTYVAVWNGDGDLVDGYDPKLVKVVGIQVVDAGTDTATGDTKAFFRVPAELNGMNIIDVEACVYTAGVTGTLDIQLRNKTQTADILSTVMTIDTTETDTSTAATPAVIDTAEDDLQTADVIAVDVDAVHSGTAAKGLFVEIRCQLP